MPKIEVAMPRMSAGGCHQGSFDWGQAIAPGKKALAIETR
jgi:hypothetical protein